MKRKQGIALLLALIVTVAVIWSAIGSMAEDRLATVWIMCKPGSYVSIREKPDKKSGEQGYLDSGDSFQTTGESKDGWIRCCGAGEGGWVWCGYVVTEKPEYSDYAFMAGVGPVTCEYGRRGTETTPDLTPIFTKTWRKMA